MRLREIILNEDSKKDIEVSQVDKRLMPFLVDDWLIFATDPVTGETWFTSTEDWHEWLDYSTPPEEMEPEEFKKAAIEILNKRRQGKIRSEWINQREDFFASELDFAKKNNVQVTPEWLDDLNREWARFSRETKANRNVGPTGMNE